MILEWFELVFIWDKVLKCCMDCLFGYALSISYLLVSEVIVEPELECFGLVNCSSGFFRFDCRLVQSLALVQQLAPDINNPYYIYGLIITLLSLMSAI